MFGWNSTHLRECQPGKMTQTHFTPPSVPWNSSHLGVGHSPGNDIVKPESFEIWVLPLTGMGIKMEMKLR